MAWTTAGSFASGTASTQAVTNTTIGNVRIVWTIASAQPVVSGGGVATWNNTVVYDATENPVWMVIAWGLVTATGAQTVSVTNSPLEINTQELVPPLPLIAIDVSGHLSGTTSADIAGVSLNVSNAGELWVGYAVSSGSASAGSLSGVTYTATPTANVIGWALNAPSGAYAPDYVETGNWDTLALTLVASPAVVAPTVTAENGGSLGTTIWFRTSYCQPERRQYYSIILIMALPVVMVAIPEL